MILFKQPYYIDITANQYMHQINPPTSKRIRIITIRKSEIFINDTYTGSDGDYHMKFMPRSSLISAVMSERQKYYIKIFDPILLTDSFEICILNDENVSCEFGEFSRENNIMRSRELFLNVCIYLNIKFPKFRPILFF